MTASDLLVKVDRFLREQTRVDVAAKEQSLQLVWQSPPIDPLELVVDSIRTALSRPTETFERLEPNQQSLAFAKLCGKKIIIPEGSRLRRIVWKLADGELPVVARWLDQHEVVLARHKASAFAHRHVGFHWLRQYKDNHVEFPEAIMFGVVLSHPRHIQIPFLFYDVDHYLMIKRYMEDIGLASLLDDSIRPKGALSVGIAEGAV